MLALNDFEDDKMARFYSEEFKIDFIPFDAISFVKELNDKCKSRNLLKKVAPLTSGKEEFKEVSFSDLKKLIGHDKVGDVIETLLGHFSWHLGKYVMLFKELILIKGQYNDIKQKEAKHIISDSDLILENSKIREKLFELIEKAKSQ